MTKASQSTHRSDNDTPTSSHTDTHTHCHAILQSQTENNKFPWQTLKPLVKTSQQHNMKTCNHASIFWDMQHVIWDQRLWANILQSAPLSPILEKEKHPNAATLPFHHEDWNIYNCTWWLSAPFLISQTCWSPHCWAHSPRWHHWLGCANCAQ